MKEKRSGSPPKFVTTFEPNECGNVYILDYKTDLQFQPLSSHSKYTAVLSRDV